KSDVGWGGSSCTDQPALGACPRAVAGLPQLPCRPSSAFLRGVANGVGGVGRTSGLCPATSTDHAGWDARQWWVLPVTAVSACFPAAGRCADNELQDVVRVGGLVGALRMRFPSELRTRWRPDWAWRC